MDFYRYNVRVMSEYLTNQIHIHTVKKRFNSVELRSRGTFSTADTRLYVITAPSFFYVVVLFDFVWTSSESILACITIIYSC